MFRAAVADGVIDVRQVNPFDPRSYFRLGEIVTAYNEQLQLRWALFEHGRIAAALSSRLFSAEVAESLFKAENNLNKEVRRLLLHLGPDADEEVLKTYHRQWELQYGQLSDPQVQSNVDAVAAALRATREANARSAQS